ncbi:hypothetical protein MOQ_009132 [Trypanosoma cruzi marinkellei]|uniref:Uncharacterized protein n=1 Tax=Trypanosoma cruzi marinkellei TaxID=85056 RepID=K2MNC9_TRYCR|nr:hypothetical protein MOQ_009132 [Trypanosoma cruzi marinkellei]
MFGELEYVSFAYITPSGKLPCELVEQQQLSSMKQIIASYKPSDATTTSSSCSCRTSSGQVQAMPVLKESGTKVYVKFFDTLRKATRTQCFSVRLRSNMSYIYEMVHAWLPDVGNLVCYTVHSDSHGVLYPLVKAVLHPQDDLPEIVFSQEVFLPFHKLTHSWGVVNVFVLQHNGCLVPGYIPLIVYRSSMQSKEAIQEQIRQLCCASPLEANYMKSQHFFNCTVSTGLVDLVSFFDSFTDDSASLSQIVVVYPALAPGDLVHLDIMDRKNRRFGIQGMINCSRQKDGILCYDVEEMTTGYLLEGLTCVQVLPL